jgi:hypothetical protein
MVLNGLGVYKGSRDKGLGLTGYWSSKGQGYLGVGILYGEVNLAGEREKQRQQINDEACAIYQDVYEYVEKI